MLRRSQRGFTLIELLVVIAIIAVLIGLLLPPVKTLHRTLNEAAAIGALRTLETAQALFREGDKEADGDIDYASTLEELTAARLLDPSLSDGVHGGYKFEMTAHPSGQAWAAVASPTAPLRYLAQLAVNVVDYVDGDEIGFLYIDETGLLRRDPCPPGFIPIVIGGKLECEPATIQIKSSLGSGPGPTDLAIASLQDLSQAFPGALSEAKRALADPAFVEAVKTRYDADGNGRLAFGELLGADLLAIARDIVGRPLLPQPPIGDDAALRSRIAELLESIRKAQAFTDDEDLSVPAVLLDDIKHRPAAESLLEFVSEDPRKAALGVLQAAIGGLDVRPDGDMVDPDLNVNKRRKGRLMETAESLTEHLRFGRFAAMRDELRRLRTRAAEWLVPEAAGKIVSLVDRALAAVG